MGVLTTAMTDYGAEAAARAPSAAAYYARLCKWRAVRGEAPNASSLTCPIQLQHQRGARRVVDLSIGGEDGYPLATHHLPARWFGSRRAVVDAHQRRILVDA